MTGPRLHITIATEPRSDLSVATEVRLVKAALLYADDVTLTSANAAMLDQAGKLLDAPERVRARRLLEVASVLLDPDQQQLMAITRNRKARRKIKAIGKLEEGVSDEVRETERVIRQQRHDAGMEELEPAIDAGLLKIDELGYTPVELVQDCILLAAGKRGRSTAGNRSVEVLFERIGAVASLGAGTYPLFDAGARDLVAMMIREGRIENPAVRPAGEVALSTHHIDYIPTFPDATVSEIIDVRRALERPLVGFRAAMATMSGKLEVAVWEPGFAEEADALYRAEVGPELDALTDAVRASGALTLLRDVALSPTPYAAGGAFLALGLGAATVIPEVAAAAFAASPLAMFLAGAAEAAKLKMERQGVAGKNRFMFLHQTDVELTERHRRRQRTDRG